MMKIRIDMAGRSADHIASLGDEDIIKAIVMPNVPARAVKVFSFLRENENLVTVAGGMNHYVTGLDRSKLAPTAEKMYGIDLSRYRFAVNWYEEGLRKRQQISTRN